MEDLCTLIYRHFQLVDAAMKTKYSKMHLFVIDKLYRDHSTDQSRKCLLQLFMCL